MQLTAQQNDAISLCTPSNPQWCDDGNSTVLIRGCGEDNLPRIRVSPSLRTAIMSKISLVGIIVSIIAASLSVVLPAHSASFDCKSAKHPNEKLICQSSELSALDDEMAEIFTKINDLLNSSDRRELRNSQRQWLRDRLDCDDDFVCTKKASAERIQRLKSVLAKLTGRSNSKQFVERCRVADPDPPLNARSTPNGSIVGKLNNGAVVMLLDRASDNRGASWAYVGNDSGVPIGWVYRDYLECTRLEEARPNEVPRAATPPQHEETVVSTGSGFFAGLDGYIVTNAHVVAGCMSVRSSRGGAVTRIAMDQASDLALYLAAEKPKFGARLRGGKGPRVGETIVAVGFPLKGLLSSDPIVTTGTISALAGLRGDRRVLQITAPVQPGNSGGPLLGENGSLVGVVQGKLDAKKFAEMFGDIPQNVNFAVSVGTLQSFLNANGVQYLLDDGDPATTPADIAADASRYTVLLECVNPPATQPTKPSLSTGPVQPILSLLERSFGRWASGSESNCELPNKSYSLRVSGGTIVWQDGLGNTDIETIITSNENEFRTATVNSIHRSGRGYALGTAWTYSSSEVGGLQVTQGQRTFKLARCR